MRHMSFSLTMLQVRTRQKTVTRRFSWWNLQPGDFLLAIEKGQGLKRGERVMMICPIRIVAVRRERLDEIVRPGSYGVREMILEGFPGLDPQDFLFRFVGRAPYPDPDAIVNRIEFDYSVPAGWVQPPA